MTSSIVSPASRFSKSTFTGVRVPFRTHAPLTFPGMLSTAGHCDQSILFSPPSTMLAQAEIGRYAALQNATPGNQITEPLCFGREWS